MTCRQSSRSGFSAITDNAAKLSAGVLMQFGRIAAQQDRLGDSSRMFGADAKVSLHASGYCQWSCTDAWVTRIRAERNADRHIVRWKFDWPTGPVALHVFSIQIPESELRILANDEDTIAVHWLSIPPQGCAAVLDCYMTACAAEDPTKSDGLPYSLLKSIRQRDGRWFVVFSRVETLDRVDLERLRHEIRSETLAQGLEVQPEFRAVGFGHSKAAAKSMVELCLD